MRPYYSSHGLTIYHGKTEELLLGFPAKYYGVLVLDPPFTFKPGKIGEVLSRFQPFMTDEFQVIDLVSIESVEKSAKFGHPHVRDLGQMREVLRHTAGVILDPYMGAGTTLVAAKQLGRHAVGIDIEEKYCKIAAFRIESCQ